MQARFRRKEAGQSIPIIALIIVVLFGMVGLSVDVGNTYAEQRGLVRATNAAALAGMNKFLAGGNDQNIAATIRASLESNGIKVAATADGAAQQGERRFKALYLNPDGVAISACRVGSCGTVPVGVSYIQVTTDGVVDTYFARVVGRNTLPVNANAWSAQCMPINGVYPIAVQNGDLDANGFVPPTTNNHFGSYTDSNYQDMSWRRIYLNPNGSAKGTFSFLRWSNAADYGDAGKDFEGDGTLGKKEFFEVTPWPDSETTAPANYPLAPGQMSLGDWIYGNSGLGWGDVSSALDTLRANRTALILPIIDGYVGDGSTTAFHLARLGRFYIKEVGAEGAANYLDLVYLGRVDGTACLQTNVEPIAPSTPPLSVKGAVFVNPRWTTPNPKRPISYQIVLDVSGSMSLDYYGYGTYGVASPPKEANIPGGTGTDYRCDNWDSATVPPPHPTSQGNKYDCVPGNNTFWRQYQERRVYAAKDAVRTLINQMDQYDLMRVITFTGLNPNGGETKLFPPTGWSGDKVALYDAVNSAGARSGDPYRTSGGTPGADGLSKTRSILASSSAPNTAPNGQSYKNVVIYLTDGMANYFLGGGTNKALDICPGMDQKVLVTPRCQIGQTADGTLRPVTAMINEAKKMKQADPNLVIYTIAIADAPDAGLDLVASSTN